MFLVRRELVDREGLVRGESVYPNLRGFRCKPDDLNCRSSTWGAAVATQILVDRRIDDGERLLRALDAEGLQVTSALWLYSSEWGEWRLVLASPLVDKQGPREVYKRVQQVISTLSGISLRLDQTSVVGKSHATVAA